MQEITFPSYENSNSETNEQKGFQVTSLPESFAMTMPSSIQTNALRNERSLCDELTCGDTYRWKTQDTETKDSLVQCSVSETSVFMG